ncbi:dynein axonemal assembly factor 10 [Cymbomonas tetramitiformis]|uniref:Dynein axonemal assembly factor 10 n=1 Tax=Cymbomonas tetramitiformis TaxID=36881 RepID=A0AAE0LF82_9CHLO|nr:dynein axonemal assembly factor 10 [Cymbomonas tetramitiformis]|eukprot:gene12249-14462_t
MVDADRKPQILEHLQQSLNLTVYDTKWIPSSARFVALGSYPRHTGYLSVWGLDGQNLKKILEVEKKSSFKCGTFGASGLAERRLATGDFEGHIQVWDLEQHHVPIFDVQAHVGIINTMDGCGGQAKGYGAPELVTGGRDGRVALWDTRQNDAPVMVFDPSDPNNIRDCWCVAFGNSFNDEERAVIAGYDNGDVKMFDLRMGKVKWETNVRNGVCDVQFDRKEIQMNKFTATTLESQYHVWDARTLNAKSGFAGMSEKVPASSTVWGLKHLPQNRDVFMVQGGDGSLLLYKYNYPDQRRVKDKDDKPVGVAGDCSLLSNKNVSTQPICCMDWSPDKEGLICCGSFDQTIRVCVVTKLNKV